MISYFENTTNQNNFISLHEIYERVMETVKHYSGVAMQVLEQRRNDGCLRVVLKGMIQKTSAWLSQVQYLFGCKGVGRAFRSAVAVPFLKCFPKTFKCSKDVNDFNCSSAVRYSFGKNHIFPFAIIVCSLMNNSYIMRTTSDF